MSLRLYLDDCSNSNLLADLLKKAGHEVVRPTDERIGLEGEDDAVHFRFAAARSLAIVTKNPADFRYLHDSDPRHSGILGIYQDNDPTRDMSNADIVNAIHNLEDAAQKTGLTIEGHFHALNDWRY
jgi:Domain of unknown function (DUF5615)